MRFVVAGTVSTTQITADVLKSCGANVVGIFGLAESFAKNVSGYVPLRDVAERLGIPYFEFSSINGDEVLSRLSGLAPDYVFVVGLSQLVRAEFLKIPSRCCIGFHPTRLPEGRGRAPVAWLVMDAKPGAATLFVMDEGADSGQILEQVPFDVQPSDYAGDVLRKAEAALVTALERLVPRLLAGDATAKIQDDAAASFYGKRSPEDGLIDWQMPAEDICRLIRSASRPHPGAYTFFAGSKLVVWRAEVEREFPMRGVVGRVVSKTPDEHWIVQAGSGLVRLLEIEPSQESSAMPTVGGKLGIDPQNGVFELHQRVARLEKALEQLLKQDGIAS